MRPRSSGRAGRGNPTSPPTAHLPLPHQLCPLGHWSPLETRCQEAWGGGRRGSEPPETTEKADASWREGRRGAAGRPVPPVWCHAGRGPQPPAPSVFCLSSGGGRPWRRLWRGEEKQGVCPPFGCLGHRLQRLPLPRDPLLQREPLRPPFLPGKPGPFPSSSREGQRVSLRMTSKMPLSPTPGLSTLKSPV